MSKLKFACRLFLFRHGLHGFHGFLRVSILRFISALKPKEIIKCILTHSLMPYTYQIGV